MKQQLKTQGFVLLDVDVAALNNAGKDNSSSYDNAVATKKIVKGSKTYVYVSGQAWRYWWRETLKNDLGWKMSPLFKDKKIVSTCTDPITFADDDVFGYMKAAKEEVVSKENDYNDGDGDLDEHKGDKRSKKPSKPKMEDVTVTRVSALRNSALVSVSPTRAATNFSNMSRHFDDPSPYQKEEYSCILKGMFSLDLNAIGTFSDYNKAGFKNLSSSLKEQSLNRGCELVDDINSDMKLVRMPLDVRVSRAVDTIKALKTVSGGAMQTNNMTDVTPKFLILCTTKSGNHPFGNIMTDGSLDISSLEEILSDCADQFIGKIYIGKRKGFMDSCIEALNALKSKFNNVEVMPINAAIDTYCEQIKTQMV